MSEKWFARLIVRKGRMKASTRDVPCVASYLPPSPTSRIQQSIRFPSFVVYCENTYKAIKVNIRKYPGRMGTPSSPSLLLLFPAIPPGVVSFVLLESVAPSNARRTCQYACPHNTREIGRPLTRIRSRISTKWGLVKRPVVQPNW